MYRNSKAFYVFGEKFPFNQQVFSEHNQHSSDKSKDATKGF